MLLGGTMLWTLDFDDYSGKFCNDGTFPLANAIKSVFDEFLINDFLNTTNQNQTVMLEFDKQYTSTLELTVTTHITKKAELSNTTILLPKLIYKEDNNQTTNINLNRISDLTNLTDYVLIDVKNNFPNLSSVQIIKEKPISVKNSAQIALNSLNLLSLIIIFFNL